MAAEILGLCLIFFARILDVSCNIVRILFLVKGRRFIASCIGFFEVMIYMSVLGHILGGGKTLTITELIVYCGGFATGNYIGAWLEEYLLNSFVLVEAIMDDNTDTQATVAELRGAGLGATVINGTGLNGPKLVVEIYCRRHDVQSVQKFFSKGFMTVYDVKRCTGGWFPAKGR